MRERLSSEKFVGFQLEISIVFCRRNNNGTKWNKNERQPWWLEIEKQDKFPILFVSTANCFVYSVNKINRNDVNTDQPAKLRVPLSHCGRTGVCMFAFVKMPIRPNSTLVKRCDVCSLAHWHWSCPNTQQKSKLIHWCHI